jgi:hypothetical protein
MRIRDRWARQWWILLSMHLLQAKIGQTRDWAGQEELSKLTVRCCLNLWDLGLLCLVRKNKLYLLLLNWTDLTLTMEELSYRNTILWDEEQKLQSSKLKELNLQTNLLVRVSSAPLTTKTMVTKIERAVLNNNSSGHKRAQLSRAPPLSKSLNLLIINRHSKVIIVLFTKEEEPTMLTRVWLHLRLLV